MCRQQALIEVPVETLWELVGDVRRHPEWWPRIIDVRDLGFAARFFRDVAQRVLG